MKYKIHGNTNKIKGKREPISMTEIGKSDCLPCFVLIEGDPGVGKTTLVWELCKSWAKGELLQEWDIVLLVQLRDTDMREADSIEKMIDPGEDYHDFCSFIKQTHGERLLLIFDGFDELSEKQREKSSVFMRLLEGLKLNKSSIFVTSRPSATSLLPKQFYDNVHQHIEIVGFEEKDIKRYIDCKFKDSEEPCILDDFNEYISSHDFIFTLMYVPLHCALVTDLYEQYWRKEEKQFAPKTLTQLYTCFICSLLERHLEDVPQYSGEQYKIHEISDLPPDIHEHLMKLSELAARGIENKEFVFENVNCETLGLLQKVSEDNRRSRNSVTSYSFPHLTLQEYLAALHWSKCGKEVSGLFEQTGALPIKQYFKKKAGPDIHWPALHFYAGLTGIVKTPLEEIIRSNQSTEYNYLYLLFECQCAELVSSVFKESEIESTVRSHMEAYVSGHCIARSCVSTRWKIKLKKSCFVVNLVHGIEHAEVNGKGGSICTLHVSSGTSNCDIIKFMNLLGQIKEYIENLNLHYETDLKTYNKDDSFKVQQFSLGDFVYKRFYTAKNFNAFKYFLEDLGCFKTLKRVTLYFKERISREQLELLDNFSTTVCMQTEERSSNDDGSLSVCSADSDFCFFGRIVRKEDSDWSYTLYALFEWNEHLEVITQFFSGSIQMMDESNISMSIFTDQHEWLLGPNEKSFMKIWLHHKHSTTDQRVVFCIYEGTKMNNFRLLVSPDNIGFLIDLFKNGVKVHFLSVYCENELIQTLVQSARDYNPGMIMRRVHLDLTLHLRLELTIFNHIKTSRNRSYEDADISGTVVEKHDIIIAEDFIPTILQQCVLLKSSIINFSMDARKYRLTISGAVSLCTVLSESTSLKGLFLSDIELNSSEATSICKGLSSNRGLETLEFRSLKGDCSVLLSGLEQQMTIKNLKIDACGQIGEGARSLCTLLSRSPSLMKLSLVNIILNSDEAMLISNGLRNNHTLETLAFRSLKGDFSVLLSGLKNHMTIKNLTIDACGQIGKGARSLCTLLSSSQSLMKLSLVNIILNSDEAVLISNGLGNNQTLETLEFKNLKGDCSVLLSGLENHKTIKNLIIDACGQIGEGANSLCTLLTQSSSLMKLFLFRINMNSDEAMSISNGLGNNQTLETVCFQSLKDPSTLLKGLSHHKTLSRLIVMHIPHTVEYLLDVMNTAKVLRHVILYDCNLTSIEFQKIISGAAANNLKEIAIWDGPLLDMSSNYKTEQFFQDVVTNRNIKITLGCYYTDGVRNYVSSLSCADRVVIMDPSECE